MSCHDITAGSKEPQLVKTKDLKDALIRELPTILQSLIQVWGPPAVNQGFSKDGELHNKYAIQDQVLQILGEYILHKF